MPIARGCLGIVCLIAMAWVFSSNRQRFPWKIVIGGLLLQWSLGLLVLKTTAGKTFFDAVGQLVMVVLQGADQGAGFVFGPLAENEPVIVGIKIMATIIIVAAISSIGYHYGILQRIVAVLAWTMRRTMGISGAESLSGAANVYFGQTEAPLLVRPYISRMTQSELMSLMTCGFATVAAGIMAVYVGILSGGDEAIALATARRLLTACLMSAPAAFVMAKIMVPETETPETIGSADIQDTRTTKNLLDAISTGASDGMKLAINVLAMLIAFIALIAIIDIGLTTFGEWRVVSPAVQWLGLEQLDLKGILGMLFSPIAWIIGIESGDCRAFGGLLGTAMATNEFVAYLSLSEITAAGEMSERSILIATYSLCGFANFSSIGIQIGGIGGIAPDRRADLVRLGPRAMLGGAAACWMTGCIAGALA